MNKVTAEDIESEEFYNLMQTYRNVQLVDRKQLVTMAYTNVKTYIAEQTNKLVEKALIDCLFDIKIHIAKLINEIIEEK